MLSLLVNLLLKGFCLFSHPSSIGFLFVILSCTTVRESDEEYCGWNKTIRVTIGLFEVCCKPKIEVGLGLGHKAKKNMALVGKWLWCFSLEIDSLWHMVICSKYSLKANDWDAKAGTVFTIQPLENSFHRFLLISCLLPDSKLVTVPSFFFFFFCEDLWIGEYLLQSCFPFFSAYIMLLFLIYTPWQGWFYLGFSLLLKF